MLTAVRVERTSATIIATPDAAKKNTTAWLRTSFCSSLATCSALLVRPPPCFMAGHNARAAERDDSSQKRRHRGENTGNAGA